MAKKRGEVVVGTLVTWIIASQMIRRSLLTTPQLSRRPASLPSCCSPGKGDSTRRCYGLNQSVAEISLQLELLVVQRHSCDWRKTIKVVPTTE